MCKINVLYLKVILSQLFVVITWDVTAYTIFLNYINGNSFFLFKKKGNELPFFQLQSSGLKLMLLKYINKDLLFFLWTLTSLKTKIYVWQNSGNIFIYTKNICLYIHKSTGVKFFYIFKMNITLFFVISSCGYCNIAYSIQYTYIKLGFYLRVYEEFFLYREVFY